MPPIPESPASGRRVVVAELALGIALVLLGAWVFWDTRHLPQPIYEPLGAAAIPRGIAALLGASGLLIAALGVTGRPAGGAPDREAGPTIPRPWLAVATCLTVAAYVGVMDAHILGFRAATFLFLAILCMALSDFRRQYLAYVVVMAAGLSLGLHYVFTQFFVLDLP